MPTALITGASAGFGRSLARALSHAGWTLVVDARRPQRLYALADTLNRLAPVTAIAGDVTDPAHRQDLVAAAEAYGGLDLLVNNASTLGPTPLPPLAQLDSDALVEIMHTNLLAPLQLVQLALPTLSRTATVVNISSDAAVEGYPGWGGYGASKAALDLTTAVLAAEHPALRWYAFDPGDMRTEMHQAAFPGEDISDRPDPDSVVPAFLTLISERPASGRYRAADLGSNAEPAIGSREETNA